MRGLFDGGVPGLGSLDAFESDITDSGFQVDVVRFRRFGLELPPERGVHIDFYLVLCCPLGW